MIIVRAMLLLILMLLLCTDNMIFLQEHVC